MIEINWGSFTLTDKEAQQFLSLFGISGDFLHVWREGASWGAIIKENETTILNANYDYVDGEYEENINEINVNPSELAHCLWNVLVELEANVEGLKNIGKIFNTMLFSKDSIKISVDNVPDIIPESAIKQAYEFALKSNTEELEEFLKQKLPEWMKGYKFYDIETEKMQKITEIHFEEVDFDIAGDTVKVWFNQCTKHTAKVGDKFAAIWNNIDSKYVEIETEFKGIPIKVRIYGDEGMTYIP